VSGVPKSQFVRQDLFTVRLSPGYHLPLVQKKAGRGVDQNPSGTLYKGNAIEVFGMPISVKLFELDGIAYASGDVQIGEAENLAPPVNTGTIILTVPLRRRRLTLNARGITEALIQGLDAQRTASINSILGGSPTGDPIELPGTTITNALLLDYQPGAPIYVESIPLLEQVQLVYDSMDWS
jgi:hypothetical protein